MRTLEALKRHVWLTVALCCAVAASMASGALAHPQHPHPGPSNAPGHSHPGLFGMGHSRGSWSSLAPIPTPVEGASTANVGNLIVVAYGLTPTGDSNQTRIYNIAHDSWSSGSLAPGPPSSEGIAVSHGNSVYALGGRSAGNRNVRYTPRTDTWTTLAPIPTARQGGLGAAVVGNSIYAIGGRTSSGGPCSGGALANVERYNIASNTWRAVASLPSPRSDLGAIAHGGKIYVFGGCGSSGTVTNQVNIYNPRTNTWSQGAPMPTARAGFYGIGVKGDRIYVMGGQTGGVGGPVSSANEVYNIAHDSWSTATPMEHPRGEMGVASHGGRIYTLGGGIPAYGTPQNTNDVFKP